MLSGGVLLSHTVSSAVPSALKGLASGFGMGPGVSLSLWPPKHYGDNNRISTRRIGDVFGGAGRFSRTTQWTRSIFVVKPSAY